MDGSYAFETNVLVSHSLCVRRFVAHHKPEKNEVMKGSSAVSTSENRYEPRVEAVTPHRQSTFT